MGGKPCKVHVDHLRPWQDEQAKPNTGTEEITVNVAPDEEDEPLVLPEDEGNTSDVLTDHDVSQPRLSPRDHKPTKRLIERFFIIIIVVDSNIVIFSCSLILF